MTESLKLAEIHRSNIDYERQRHLVNWLIKSGPHMSAAPPTHATGTASASATAAVAVATVSAQPQTAFYSAKPLPVPPKNDPASSTQQPSLSRSSFFNSQTNLPLHIMSQPADGAQPKLRRFNSHDTSANMFSVADFENARLARRNEMEIKQRQQQHQQHQLQQQQRYKMNSLSSGTGDCSTGDSKGSKFSSDSSSDPMPAERFLDRFTLPRVVRTTTVSAAAAAATSGDDTIQSSSSHGSSVAAAAATVAATPQDKGELCMLYKQVKNRKIYHGFNAKSGASRKKGVMVPQEFQGYFSLVNDKGSMSATQYTTLVQLVRERVYKFLSVDNMPAYTETPSTDTYPPRVHYVKGTAHGGQIYRLLAVFEDGKPDGSATGAGSAHATTNAASAALSSGKSASDSASGMFRDKEKGRYAQLLNENRQVMYVSLTAKGKFFEIEPTTPQIFQQKTASTAAALANHSADIGHKPPNPDCVYRLEQLLGANPTLPLTVRLISAPPVSGPLAMGAGSAAVPEHLTVSHITSETVLIVCPIDESSDGRGVSQPLQLRKLVLRAGDGRLFGKCTLGFESEQKMFLNQTVQNILKYCQCNVGPFLRVVQPEQLLVKHHTFGGGAAKGRSEGGSGGGMKILKPLNFPRLLRREKSSIAHEKEDSIIFLSKNDLENMDQQHQQQQKQEAAAMPDASSPQAAQPTTAAAAVSSKKKWFRKSTVKAVSTNNLMLDAQTKRMSMDRYQDMSKLLHERFGDHAGDDDGAANDGQSATTAQATNPVRPSSEIGVDAMLRAAALDAAAELRNKSMSMQDMQGEAPKKSPAAAAADDDASADVTVSSLCSSSAALADDESRGGGSVSRLSNFAPQQQQSFISAKLYTEFHVKTKQHSKSSSHLHNLLHFSVPQKMHISETRRTPAAASVVTVVQQQPTHSTAQPETLSVDLRDISTSTATTTTVPVDPHLWSAAAIVSDVRTTSIEDDLPYSNVRDSLVQAPAPAMHRPASAAHHHQLLQDNTNTSMSLQSCMSAASSSTGGGGGSADSLPENIYAEICTQAPAIIGHHRPLQRTAAAGRAVVAVADSSTIYSTIDTSPAAATAAATSSSIVNSRAAGSTIRISVPAIRSPLMASVVGVQHGQRGRVEH